MSAKAPIPSRRIRGKQAVLSYATAVGGVVWAANYCLDAFFGIWLRLNHPNQGIARLVWFKQSSDRAQVELVKAALLGQKKKYREAKVKRVMWAIEKAIVLQRLRNDAVHGNVGVKTPKKREFPPTTYATKPERADRLLALRNMKRSFHVLRDDFYQLGNYVWYLYESEDEPGLHRYGPLPRKPHLRSTPVTQR